MDDGVFASRRMTDALIKRAELDSTREEGRRKIRRQMNHKKPNVSLFKEHKLRLWSYYYKSMARLQGTPWSTFLASMRLTLSRHPQTSENAAVEQHICYCFWWLLLRSLLCLIKKLCTLRKIWHLNWKAWQFFTLCIANLKMWKLQPHIANHFIHCNFAIKHLFKLYLCRDCQTLALKGATDE